MSPRARPRPKATTARDDTRRVLDALRRIVRDLRQAGERGALGPARLYVMQQIGEHGPLSVGELAALTRTTPPSVSVVVQHLVVAGLLARAADPRDRRRQLLTLTRSGQGALRRAPVAAQHGLVAAIDALPAPSRKTLARLLERIAGESGSPSGAPLFFEDDRSRGPR